MNYELIFEDLSPLSNVEEQIRRKIDALMDSAPSDASAFSSLKKVKEGYKGILRIMSSQGRFVAEAVSGNVNDLVGSLARQISDQIREWRGYRFLN